MLWDHIAQLLFSDLDFGIHLLPKLTADHINLKSFPRINVSFAVQVLIILFLKSSSVTYQEKKMKLLNSARR